jgi:hypothetical protein
MSEDSKTSGLAVNHKRGVPIYEKNPSVPEQGEISRARRTQLGTEHKGLIINGGSGEILGNGTAVVYELEEVDSERFVKLFLSGFKQATGLSKAGLQVFDVVYGLIRQSPNNDKIDLNFFTASKHIKNLNERTYRRGLRDLLDREFLFRTPSDGVFFVNIRYMFNGDRLAFVKAYQRKGTQMQTELALLPPE